MHDMNHMYHLSDVASLDVKALNEKETTYQGSWKRRGGVGAFMMMARKWDRLESILGGSAWNYDIFHAIQAQTLHEKTSGIAQGSDGTVLAEVRDLRRYLTLVEAEIMSRAATEAGQQRASDLDAIAKRGVAMTEERRVPRYDSAVPHKHGHNDAVSQIAERPPAPAPMMQRTPEDGAQHESLAPWVCHGDYFHRKEIDATLRDKFWCRRSTDVWVLEPFVANFQIPRVLRDCYNMRGETWVMRPERVPPDAREFFPVLGREKNMKEHGDLPEWQRVLYTWIEDQNKFVLADVNEAWHVDEAA